MLSQLTLSVFDLNTLISQKILDPAYFIRYNPSTSRAECISNLREILTPYNFLEVVVVASFLRPAAFIYIILGKGIFSREISRDMLFLQMVICAGFLLSNALRITCYRYRYDIVVHANLLLDLIYQRFPHICSPCQTENFRSIGNILKEFFKEVKKLATGNRNADVVGLALILQQFAFPLGTITFFVVEYFGKLDTFTLAVEFLAPKKLIADLNPHLVKLLSSFLFSVIVREYLRTLNLIFTHIVMVAFLTVSLIQRIKLDCEQSVTDAFREYQILYSIHSILTEAMESITFVVYQFGRFLVILVFTGSIIGMKFLSTEAHYFNIIGASLCVGVVIVVVPMGTLAAELSYQVILELNKNVQTLEGCKPYTKRVLKALRPIGFSIGQLGLVDNAFKRKFWTMIISNTQDLTLMVLGLVRKNGWSS